MHSRGQFARICVEVDLTKKLVSKIEVLGHILCLEYEGLHSICFSCGRFGHKADQCMEKVTEETVAGDPDGATKQVAAAMDEGGANPNTSGGVGPDLAGSRGDCMDEENQERDRKNHDGADQAPYGP